VKQRILYLLALPDKTTSDTFINFFLKPEIGYLSQEFLAGYDSTPQTQGNQRKGGKHSDEAARRTHDLTGGPDTASRAPGAQPAQKHDDEKHEARTTRGSAGTSQKDALAGSKTRGGKAGKDWYVAVRLLQSNLYHALDLHIRGPAND
jgi:hypothetical protein